MRISLGLKPLVMGGAAGSSSNSGPTKEESEQNNYQEYQATLKAEKEKQDLQERIKKYVHNSTIKSIIRWISNYSNNN